MLPFKKFMFPIYVPSEYSCTILDNMHKLVSMEYGYKKNGVFVLHLYDYTDDSIFEPVVTIRELMFIVPSEYPHASDGSVKLIMHSYRDQLKKVAYPVLEVPTVYFPKDFNLYKFPDFRYGSVIYENHKARRTWSVTNRLSGANRVGIGGVEVIDNQFDEPDEQYLAFALGLDRLEVFE